MVVLKNKALLNIMLAMVVGAGLSLAALLVAAMNPAEAAFPGQNGKIAFTSDRDGTTGIYTMSASGTGLDRLTTQDDREPAWSPDGSTIAFTSNRDGNAEIYTMNANGTGLSNLTKNPQDDREPA